VVKICFLICQITGLLIAMSKQFFFFEYVSWFSSYNVFKFKGKFSIATGIKNEGGSIFLKRCQIVTLVILISIHKKNSFYHVQCHCFEIYDKM